MTENTSSAENYVLFADKSKSISGLNKRMLFIMLPLILLMFAFSRLAHGFFIPVRSKTPPYSVRHIHVSFGPVGSVVFTGLPWFLLAECGGLYLIMARSHKKASAANCRSQHSGDRSGYSRNTLGVDSLGRSCGSSDLQFYLPLCGNCSEEFGPSQSAHGETSMASSSECGLCSALQTFRHLCRAYQHSTSLPARHCR